jgi:hypothetical protein
MGYIGLFSSVYNGSQVAVSNAYKAMVERKLGKMGGSHDAAVPE